MRAQELDGDEFWLPVELFHDDFFIEDNRTVAVEDEVLRPSVAPCTPSSSQREPATETQTGEGDYVARLTRCMAHTLLFEGNGVSTSNVKVPAMGTYSMSTESAAGMRPNGPSQFSSPLSTSLVQKKKQIEPVSYGRRIPSQLQKPCAPAKHPVARCLHNPMLAYQQLQAEQFYQLKQQQLIKQQLAIGLTLPARSSVHHQHPVTGMKAVLLDISRFRRPSAGTGVFLPKRIDFPNESHKKPARSSVIPARIFQTLNLNQEGLRFQPRIPGSSAPDYELALAHGKFPLAPQKWYYKQYHLYHTPASPPPAVPTGTSHEIRLPTEWTY